MDIDIVNATLRLCVEEQTCLFEVPSLYKYCLEHNLCSNPKYIIPSIKNYIEIFKISRDKNRIEFFMPFEICRNKFIDGICQNSGGAACSNFHVCYDYFYGNSCRHAINCQYPHRLTEKYHKIVLGSLINLDLDILTKAFRVYCQSKKYLMNYNSLKSQQSMINSPIFHNSSSSSSTTNNIRTVPSPQINGTSSWKTNNRSLVTLRNLPKEPTKISSLDQGVQICWKPLKDIQAHFIEVIFSNQGKSNGGPIQTQKIYQHLGIAQVFYQQSNIAERVVLHEPIKFQSFVFTSRILQRIADKRHLCFSNIPPEINHFISYIDLVSMPYKKINCQYYQNDKNIVIVEYDKDIDFSTIFSNVRSHPECNGLMINCIQLYRPETLLIEYDKELSEHDIMKLFNDTQVFHIKTYSHCSFVHFYSHDVQPVHVDSKSIVFVSNLDLTKSINKTFDNFIRVTPIYIDMYSDKHLNEYLKRRTIELQSIPFITTSTSTLNTIDKNESISTIETIRSSQSSVPILPPPSKDQKTEFPVELKSSIPLRTSTKQESILSTNETQSTVIEKDNDSIPDSNQDNETVTSEDDFHDIPSDFDNDDLFLDEAIDDQSDMEYLRSAAKNLMTSLAEMEEANTNAEADDTPHSLLYGDDYVVTIKSRRFTLAFLDYTQFRVERQRNPDKFRLLTSLKKASNKKRLEQIKERDQTPSPTSTIETKTNKKKRNKRNKKKKTSNNNDKDDDDDDNDDDAGMAN